MRRVTMIAGFCALLVGGSAAATESESLFDQLHQLDEDATEGRQRAARVSEQVAALDAELDTRWESVDVALRAARPIRNEVTEGLGRWLRAHRIAEREAMDAPHAGADTRRLLRYAAPQALPSRLRDVDVVGRADAERDDFVAAMGRRAQWSVELARTAAKATAADGSRDELIALARAGRADLGASADDFDRLLQTIESKRDVDFHRQKGTLARPVTTAPVHRFGASAPLVRPTGWTYRVDKGTEVHAVGAGQVVYQGMVQGFGLVVVLDHGAGYLSSYAHLDSTTVEVGSMVERADVFGAVGDSGSLDGSRLYFELRKGDAAIDPAGWFLKN